MKKSKANHEETILNKTQQVHYQREFKQADRVYNELSNRGNRS